MVESGRASFSGSRLEMHISCHVAVVLQDVWVSAVENAAAQVERLLFGLQHGYDWGKPSKGLGDNKKSACV
jgi:hypothetical protein